ncbi:MAG: hypothetical protein A2Y25_02700 [Candidatus Melainabacteria bacterium GWF2_37_15]|nr:MAG: hypothetical protein A2Y25_02700 [Candidatus Melainabacteria bacterium GWF2_37_15]
MKKIISIFYLFLILIFSSAYVFPDKLPDWKNASVYSPEKLKFQKTTLDEFKKLCPEVKSFDAEKNVSIITTQPYNLNDFNEINVGFRNKTLDWIEFVLSKQINVNEFITIYGFPKYIDTKYSTTLDYYNYDNYSVAVDKKSTNARSISFFTTQQSVINKTLRNKILDTPTQKFFETFPKLKPGLTVESEFTQSYPDLLPYMEGEFDVNSTYTMVEELEGASQFYQQAVLRFENGILTWISLVPTDAESSNILKTIKEPHEIEKIDDKYDFYIYENFVLTVNKKHKKVSNIGLINFDKRF